MIDLDIVRVANVNFCDWLFVFHLGIVPSLADLLPVLVLEAWLIVVLVILLHAGLILDLGLLGLDKSRVLRGLLVLILNFGALLRRLATRLTLLRAQTYKKRVIDVNESAKGGPLTILSSRPFSYHLSLINVLSGHVD